MEREVSLGKDPEFNHFRDSSISFPDGNEFIATSAFGNTVSDECRKLPHTIPIPSPGQ